VEVKQTHHSATGSLKGSFHVRRHPDKKKKKHCGVELQMVTIFRSAHSLGLYHNSNF